MKTLPGSMVPAMISACSSFSEFADFVSLAGSFGSMRTLNLTLSHLSPSMMSSAPLPQIWSEPEPPMMMSPAPNSVAPAGSRSARPLMRLMPSASSTFVRPGTPTSSSPGLAGTESSPRRMSFLSQPERPSTSRNLSLSAFGPSTTSMRMSESPASQTGRG